MKLAWRDIEPFVKNPNPAARVILIYGPDGGLMRERSRTIALSIVADIHDPFNVAVLGADAIIADPARLIDEANAISMMGGNRLIRIENASDKLTPVLKSYLAAPSAHTLILLEAGELPSRSPLRQLCEKSAAAAALPCYVDDERDVARLIRETLSSAGIRIDNDAAAWLAGAIKGDRAKIRGELEKLITFHGGNTAALSLQDVQSVCGDNGALKLDDLVFGAGGQRAGQALAAYNLLIAEGVGFIGVLRPLQNHFRRLHIVRARLDRGETMEGALKKLSPEVFFKNKDDFVRQVNAWRPRSLERVMMRLMDIEAECKRTHAPTETLCAQAVLGIATMRR